MKASKNINTAPTRGKTSGMKGTTASTASASGATGGDVGLDMMFISLGFQIRKNANFTHAGAASAVLHEKDRIICRHFAQRCLSDRGFAV